ncbi:MAG: thiolase family protein [Candidatus Omnitrophota bacterium]
MNSQDYLKEIFILDAVRTPIGSSFRSLKEKSAAQLGSVVLKEILKRTKVKPDWINEVIFGNTVSAGIGQNLARQASVLAGLAHSLPASTVNNVCGSGLQAVIQGARTIGCQEADCVIAGAAESVSHCPYLVERKDKEKIVPEELKDSLIHDGLTCQMTHQHMGELAEAMARKFNVSRREQDQFTLESHTKAMEAREKKKFASEIIPVALEGGRVFLEDERVRKNISCEKLAELPSAFSESGTITAGNASAPADGAAAVLLASQRFAQEHKLHPQARILGFVSAALKPSELFEGAILSIRQCLEKCHLGVQDIDLFEVCEAFSVQAITTRNKLKIPDEKFNIYGGDIALGHPLGVAGLRVLVTLIHALINEKKKKGLAAVCFGGGGSIAMVAEII